jgi:hypothetical protein
MGQEGAASVAQRIHNAALKQNADRVLASDDLVARYRGALLADYTVVTAEIASEDSKGTSKLVWLKADSRGAGSRQFLLKLDAKDKMWISDGFWCIQSAVP